jgi:hypothetical protein
MGILSKNKAGDVAEPKPWFAGKGRAVFAETALLRCL